MGDESVLLKVQLFAKARELAAGKPFLEVKLSPEDRSIVCQAFQEKYIFLAEPALRTLQGSAFLALNDEYCLPDQVLTLRAGDDLAFIPPISGGLVDGIVQYEPPPLLPNGGGENAFLGRTRAEAHPLHGNLLLLRYEAKASMAIKLLTEIAKEVAASHGLIYVRVLHSMGDVPVGQPSVLVQVVGEHRKETFPATAEIMDKLKAKVPIWKQEVWSDGATWKDGAAINPSA